MLKITAKIFILISILFYALVNASVIKAETILFEDDFSSNNFEKWESVRNHLYMWSIVDEQANVFVNTRSTLAELVPKDMYWNPEWKNIIYELDYKYIQGADKNISFGFKDVRNWYEIHFVGGNYYLSHVKGGRVVWDHKDNFSLVSGAIHHVSINLNEGSIIVNIDGKEIINVIDPTFDNDYGKIGLKAGAGSIFPTKAIYDNIIVKSLNNIINKLDINIMKQTDSAWKDEEYDDAKTWADSTGIDRWGCSITSISMIMNFHGIDKMPNDEPVNPSTINTWLKSQADGYVGSGLVNWIAITRLTKLINAQYETVKLEYKRNSGESLETAKNEILENKPVILQIPGHFLVGNGIVDTSDSDNEDLYIADPAYTYEKLSQHKKPLLSTRTFQPTFTDLSYIHLSHNPNFNVEIKKENGTEINNLQVFEEYISDFIASETLESGGYTQNNSPITKIHEIEKPENGTYIIEVSQESFGKADLTIFTYNKNGDLSNLSYSGLVGKNKIQLKLTYDNEGNSHLEKIINFNTLINDIDELLETKEIKKHYVAVELKKYAQFGADSSSENSLRYVDALQKLIEWYSPQITENGKTYLNQRLAQIKGIMQE